MEVGRITARLDALFDDRNFDKFDRRYDASRRKAERGARAELKGDVDTRGFDKYDRALGNVEKSSKDAERSHGRFVGAIGKSGAYFRAVGTGAAAGGLALGIFAKKAIDSASDINESITKNQTLFGKYADGIDKFSKTAATSLGMSRSSVLEYTGTFGNLFNALGITQEKSAGMSKHLVQLAADMASFNNSSPEEALDAIRSGLVGETEPLRRFGVNMNDATLRAQALKMHLIKSTKEALDPQTKALAASALITKQTSAAHGDFAKTSGGLANQTRILKAQFSNLVSEVGVRLLPIALKVVGGLNSLFKTIKGGGDTTKKAGAAIGGIRGIITGVGNVFRSVFNFVGKVIDDNRDTIHAFQKNAASAFGIVSRLVKSVGAVIRQVFGNSGTGKDIRQIISAFLKISAAVQAVFIAVARRALPGIITAFRGLATVVKGIIQVISGILTLDFGKAWEGVKNIFSGAIKIIGGLLRAATAPFRELASKIGGAIGDAFSATIGKLPGIVSSGFSKVMSYLESLPGRWLQLGKRMVSSLASGLSGIGGAVLKAFSATGNFLGNIGRNIADWINAHTVFGDQVKLGPIKVRIPALAQGGRVGPFAGGARIFVAGEGNADEWVISQEGDRAKNIRWAVEALESLTGKRIAMHGKGKAPKSKKKRTKPKPKARSVKEALGTKTVRALSVGEAGLKNFERDIGRMERAYGQKEREFDQSEEMIVVENEDGSATIDDAALSKRRGELNDLIELRKKIESKVKDYRDAALAMKDVYSHAKDRLRKAQKARRNKPNRSKYGEEITAYTTRINELSDIAGDLLLDLEDQRLDILDLKNEKSANEGSTGHAAPASGDTPTGGTGTDTTGTGTTTGGDTTGGDIPTDPGTAAPTPEQIAAAASAQVATFMGAQSELFGQFGSNFVAAGASPFGSDVGVAAGARFFGADPSYGNTQTQAGGGINIQQHFAAPPPDPHTWSQGVSFELKAAS